MFKPKVNTTPQVCNDVKIQKNVTMKTDASTRSKDSSSTIVNNTEVAVPVQIDVSEKNAFLNILNTAGNPCPDLGIRKQVFTSNEQLSESDFGRNDI